MKATVFVATAIAGFGATSYVLADGDPTRGAQHYRACVACHTLGRREELRISLS
jgi:cytochrome c2